MRGRDQRRRARAVRRRILPERLLARLQATPGEYVCREQLYAALYPNDTPRPIRPDDAVHRAIICLRRSGHRILTKYGYGYALVASPAGSRQLRRRSEVILARLQAAGGATVSVEQLREAVWPDGERPASTTGSITEHIMHLRDAGYGVATERGKGYRLERLPA